MVDEMLNSDDSKLIWSVEPEELLYKTPVFDIYSQKETAANGVSGNYIAAKAPDWVMVIPKLGDNFLMVKQWRHAAKCLSIEFPGGVCDPGEDVAVSAARELEEETGYKAVNLVKLGEVSPNPALFMNRFHIFLAEELQETGVQNLDADELLQYLMIPIDRVIEDYGKAQYPHALMGTALMMYMRYMNHKR